MTVESQAKRCLSHLTNYHGFAGDTSIIPEALPGTQLQAMEDMVGYYSNTTGDNHTNIGISNIGLHYFQGGRWQCVTYDEIVYAQTPSDKDNAWELRIRLQSGNRIALPVKGGEGKSRDVFAFLRFIDRVRRDLEEKVKRLEE